jgi:hypothetical protein
MSGHCLHSDCYGRATSGRMEQVSVTAILKTCIWEVLTSKRAQHIGYPDSFYLFIYFFGGSPHSIQVNAGAVPWLGQDCLFPNLFQFIIHQVQVNR